MPGVELHGIRAIEQRWVGELRREVIERNAVTTLTHDCKTLQHRALAADIVHDLDHDSLRGNGQQQPADQQLGGIVDVDGKSAAQPIESDFENRVDDHLQRRLRAIEQLGCGRALGASVQQLVREHFFCCAVNSLPGHERRWGSRNGCIWRRRTIGWDGLCHVASIGLRA